MGLNIQTATRLIKTFLEENLVDPLNERTTAWIYDDGMRIDLDKSPYPKILLKKSEEPSNKQQLAIGNPATENTDIIYVEIKAMTGQHYTQEEVDYTAEEFIGLLAKQTLTLIQNNHDAFVTLGFLDVLCVRDVIEIDRDRNPTFRVGVQMHYISTP